jgi:hypothetical protein
MFITAGDLHFRGIGSIHSYALSVINGHLSSKFAIYLEQRQNSTEAK